MRDPATRLFLRFQRARDGRALARLFDVVAPELLAVATHLAPDVASAEDLVQATFVVVLEHAERFDAAREVKPWLFGILAREAAQARRRAAREVDGERAARPDEAPSPQAASEALETRAVVARALARLPARYREVLEPYLAEGLSAPEIARRIGGESPPSAGHVRVLIGRGLERLRAVLPHGFALGALGALVGNAPRGHAAVRAAVLQRAGLEMPSALSLAALGAFSTLVGFFAMTKTRFACVVVAAVLLWERSDPTDAPIDARSADVAAAAPAELGDALESGVAASRPVLEAPDAPERRAPAVAEASPSIAATPEAIAIISGRVIDAEGRPVPGAQILGPRPGGPLTETNGEGEFELDPASAPSSVSAHHPDHAPSLAWRVVPDVPLELVLRGPAAALRLHVLDERGAPVAGASVLVKSQLAGESPSADKRRPFAPPDDSGLTDGEGGCQLRGLMPGGASLWITSQEFVSFNQELRLIGGDVTVLEARLDRGRTVFGRVLTPAGNAPQEGWIAEVASLQQIQIHPFPRKLTLTREDGTYRLQGISQRTSQVYAFVPGYERATFDLGGGTESEMRWDPQLVPSVDKSISGRVVDERGEPLAGWYVCLHDIDPRRRPTEAVDTYLWREQVETTAEGQFVLARLEAATGHVSVKSPDADFGRGTVLIVQDVAAGTSALVLRVLDAARPTCSVRGRLVYSQGDCPTAANVWVRPVGESMMWSHEVDAEGGFEVSHLTPGAYEIGLVPLVSVTQRVISVTLVSNEALDLGDLSLPQPGRVRCALACPDAAPFGRLDWSVCRLDSGRKSLGYLQSGLPPQEFELCAGEYRFELQCSDYRSEPVTATVVANGVTDVELVLEPRKR